jgi:hypothetical protein
VLIIALAWPRGRDTPVLRRWVLAGLGLSLAGDVALLWPQQGFLPGLVSFLLAHLAYLVAFTRVQRLAARVAALSAYAARGGRGAGAAVARRSGGAARAGGRLRAVPGLRWRRRRRCCGARRPHDAAARRLALGGALFLTSDALLATNRFAWPLPLACIAVDPGHLLAPAGTPPRSKPDLHRVVAGHLRAGGPPPAPTRHAEIDPLGEFHLDDIDGGTYVLTLRLGPDEIVLPPIEVGDIA